MACREFLRKPCLLRIKENEFLLWGFSYHRQEVIVARMILVGDSLKVSELFLPPSTYILEWSWAQRGETFFFYGRHIQNSSDEWLDRHIGKNVVFTYDTATGVFEQVLDMQCTLGIESPVYVVCMCVSSDQKYLLLGSRDELLVVDFIAKKHLHTVHIQYLSSLTFIRDDTELVVGTWEYLHIVKFEDLLQMDKL